MWTPHAIITFKTCGGLKCANPCVAFSEEPGVFADPVRLFTGAIFFSNTAAVAKCAKPRVPFPGKAWRTGRSRGPPAGARATERTDNERETTVAHYLDNNIKKQPLKVVLSDTVSWTCVSISNPALFCPTHRQDPKNSKMRKNTNHCHHPKYEVVGLVLIFFYSCRRPRFKFTSSFHDPSDLRFVVCLAMVSIL